jgi:hypothetical protein
MGCAMTDGPGTRKEGVGGSNPLVGFTPIPGDEGATDLGPLVGSRAVARCHVFTCSPKALANRAASRLGASARRFRRY